MSGIFSEKLISAFSTSMIYEWREKDNRHILTLQRDRSTHSFCNVLGALKVQLAELEHETVE